MRIFTWSIIFTSVLIDKDFTVDSNFTTAAVDWFVDASAGNLHLAYDISGVVDAGEDLAAVEVDIDGDPRPINSRYDIGADEYDF